MKILLLDRDTDFAKRFRHYLNKKYTHVQVFIIDNIETAQQQLGHEVYDVVLFDATFDKISEEFEMLLKNSAFAYISETHEIINNRDTIFKYNSISELYTQICSIYEKKKNRVIRQNKPEEDEDFDKETEIILFLPVHGGVGSSTMAAACAIALSQERETLYINLEQRPSDAVFFSGSNKKGVTELLTMLQTKSKKENAPLVIEKVIQKDQKQHSDSLSFVKGYTNIMDCVSMTGLLVNSIFEELHQLKKNRYIIIDADFIVSDVLNRLILNSDKLVFVSSGSDISNSKLTKIHRYLEILNRTKNESVPPSFLLLNQYYGINDELSIARNMEIIAKFARYRTNEKGRIASQDVIDQVLSKKEAFSRLR